MSRDVIVARPEMTPETAWALLDRHELRALRVVNEHKAIEELLARRALLHHEQLVELDGQLMVPKAALFMLDNADA